MSQLHKLIACISLIATVGAAAEKTEVEQLQGFIAEQVEKGKIDRSAKGWKQKLPKFPTIAYEGTNAIYWVIETSEGTMKAKLRPDVAPQHTSNTIYLSLLGFYDELNFHRIIPGFMAQGGCPLGKGFGGPGYGVNLEVNRKALHKEIGVLSMARSQSPNSAGSQFFITFGPTRSLDMQYSVFGKVEEGLDVVKKLEAAGNPSRGSNGVPPLKNITIRKTWIECGGKTFKADS